MSAIERIDAKAPAQTESLSERAREVAAVAAAHADDVDRKARFPHEAIAAMKVKGLLGIMVPAALGGEGASLAEVAEVTSAIGQACAASGMIFAMHQIKMSSLVSHGVESAWHSEFMSRVAREQLLLASATTEAGIGGDLRNSICAVEVEGDKARLEKAATVISYGSHADAILATSRRHPDAPSSDQVMTVLVKGQYDLEKTNDWDTLGMRGTCSDGFMLRGEVAAEQIFPKPFAEIAAQSMLATSHLLWASLWHGIAVDAFARAQSFVRAAARKQPSATPPGALRLAEAGSVLQAMRSGIRSGLERFEAAKADPDVLSSMGFAVAMNNVKVAASEQVLAVVDQALLVTGILGYKNGTPYSVGRHLRDAHSARLMISNDRILANTSNLLLVQRQDASLLR
ncbi:Acyl-CoA dehydrogenase [Hartmannibacter diazotrophicus]|uniref:Acyl-CoA dehydrogenase n=1 Tax=Hartmannibacter diazotrophicus TaxID=1482074 RepID=A0A2C9DAW3_9HYPH|nr:acyl-CoA dehydrogenase family protein [Hartmannibacter diazotrophicus]SON57464.1 Acyl-CoA dehydrogenase [Hartmannibacter diazotrophicus]